MKRGDLYRGYKSASTDPKRSRVFAVVSRQVLIDSKYSTVICAPIYSSYEGLSTQVPVGIEEGLKHDSAIHCDGLISVPKYALTNYIGTLTDEKLTHVNRALLNALELV